MSTDLVIVAPVTLDRSPTASACEPHRGFIEAALRVGRNAKAIREDLVTLRGFAGGYASMERSARKQRGVQAPEVRVVIEAAPGREAQVELLAGPVARVELLVLSGRGRRRITRSAFR